MRGKSKCVHNDTLNSWKLTVTGLQKCKGKNIGYQGI